MRRRRHLVVLGLCLAALQAPALAAEKPRFDGETRRFYFPNATEVAEKTIRPGGEILRRPVVWAWSGRIEAPVELQTTAGSVTIDSGTVLPAVKISGLPGETEDVLAYCTTAPRFKPKTMGFMFGTLGAKAIRSMSDGRKCLYDKDGDGTAEFGFLLDEGKVADRTPQPITPVRLNIMENREAGAGDYVSITLRQAARPAFNVDIFENGKHVSVGSQRIDVAKDIVLPSNAEVFGARFTILAHDRKSGAVTLKLSEADKNTRIPVASETVYVFNYRSY